MKPLDPPPRARVDEPVVHLDFGEHKDVTEEKDRRLRKLGWDEYGKILSERNELDRKEKNQDR